MHRGRLWAAILVILAIGVTAGCVSPGVADSSMDPAPRPDPIQGADRSFKRSGDESANGGASQQTEDFASGGQTTNSVRITCTADFDISDIHVQLRDQHGQDIGGPTDEISNVSTAGSSGFERGKGSASCQATVAKNTAFELLIDVNSDNPTWRLYIALAGPED